MIDVSDFIHVKPRTADQIREVAAGMLRSCKRETDGMVLAAAGFLIECMVRQLSPEQRREALDLIIAKMQQLKELQ
jgi:hypothetical protein